MASSNPLLAPVNGAERRDVAGVQIDMTRVGAARVRRVIYPSGFRWSSHMKPIVGTKACEHAHVGFIVAGAIGIRYADGCEKTFTAPQAVGIEPGHEGWVVGDEPAIMIEVDFEGETASRFGMADAHRH
jgi:hypothetical protein